MASIELKRRREVPAWLLELARRTAIEVRAAMGINYQGIVTQGLAKQISEKIRDAILEGRLQVHERLPTEEELAARFNVSRPTIREALKRLAAQNLVRSRRGPARNDSNSRAISCSRDCSAST